MNKDHLAAAGKILKGVAQVASGAATATGHGLIGTYCRNHHMMNYAAKMGSVGAKTGMKSVEEGIQDWKRASNSE